MSSPFKSHLVICLWLTFFHHLHRFECLTFMNLQEDHDSTSSLLLVSTMTTLMTLPKDGFPNPQALGVPKWHCNVFSLHQTKAMLYVGRREDLAPFLTLIFCHLGNTVLFFIPQGNSSFTFFLQFFCLFQGARPGWRPSYTHLFHPSYTVVSQAKFIGAFSSHKWMQTAGYLSYLAHSVSVTSR